MPMQLAQFLEFELQLGNPRIGIREPTDAQAGRARLTQRNTHRYPCSRQPDCRFDRRLRRPAALCRRPQAQSEIEAHLISRSGCRGGNSTAATFGPRNSPPFWTRDQRPITPGALLAIFSILGAPMPTLLSCVRVCAQQCGWHARVKTLTSTRVAVGGGARAKTLTSRSAIGLFLAFRLAAEFYAVLGCHLDVPARACRCRPPLWP